MAHKTNYKDALFEQRKYRMQNNPDGTVTPIDETDYTQEGDRVGALELNEIGEALNALEQEMGKRELQTYTALSQLSLEAPVTLSQLITAMPDGSYAAIDCNGTSVVSDIPSGSAAGSLEVVKVGNSGSAKYTNTSNGQVYFRGNGQWYAALVAEMILDTMEEINANTDAEMVAGALAVKELSSDLGGLTFAQNEEGDWGYIPSGADAVIPFSNLLNSTIIILGQSTTNARDSLSLTVNDLGFSKGLLVVGFSAYYMRGETSQYGKISVNGADATLLQKQWINLNNVGHAVFIYSIDNVQEQLIISATNELNSNSSLTAMAIC